VLQGERGRGPHRDGDPEEEQFTTGFFLSLLDHLL